MNREQRTYQSSATRQTARSDTAANHYRTQEAGQRVAADIVDTRRPTL